MPDVKDARSVLRDEINQDPLFLLESGKRMAKESNSARLRLMEKLLRYKHFDTALQDAADHIAAAADEKKRALRPGDAVEDNAGAHRDQSGLVLSTDESRRRALSCPEKRTMYFDGLAFTEASNTAIQYYQADKGGSFLTYFDRIYDQRMVKALQTDRAISDSVLWTKLSSDDMKILQAVSSFAATTYPGQRATELHLTNQQCHHIAQALPPKENGKRWSEAQIRNLLMAMQTAQSLSRFEDADDIPSLMDTLPSGPSAEDEAADAFASENVVQAFCQAARFYDSMPQQENTYNAVHTVLTNSLLQTIHPPTLARNTLPETNTLCEQIRRNGEQLYRDVFHMPYIRFVGWRLPETTQDLSVDELHQIESLCNAIPQKQLQDQTVAHFLAKSSGYVSQMKRKCRETVIYLLDTFDV